MRVPSGLVSSGRAGTLSARTKALAVLVPCVLVLGACGGSDEPKAEQAGKPAVAAGVQDPGLGPGGKPTTLTADQLVEQLRAAGLPVTATVRYSAANDDERLLGTPGGYLSKTAFVDKRVVADGLPDTSPGSVWLGGRVEVFGSPADAERRQREISGRASDPAKAEYVYVRGNVVLRVSHGLDATYADGYAKLLVRAG